MKNSNAYLKENEIEDTKVTDFLKDINIALGHDYQQRGHQLFPQFSPEYQKVPADGLPLFERLFCAYKGLDDSQKSDAKLVVQNALVRCARMPMGLKRSLVCVDLAHEIDPALGSESLYSALMFRPTDSDELAEWLWQLIRRWKKWHIKVESTSESWKKAIKLVSPKGLLDLLQYLQTEQVCISSDSQMHSLLHIALERIDKEEDALLDVGYDPEILKDHLSRLESSFSKCGIDHYDLDVALPSDISRERCSLLKTLPSRLKGLNKEKLINETQWWANDEILA